MYYFDLYATGRCNLKCDYCLQDRTALTDADYNLNDLKRYIMTFQGEKCIVFYGGEPLLNTGFIKDVMSLFATDHIKFGIQTNGTLLNRLSKQELALFDMVMVSVDGLKNSHDKFRGKGTYDVIINNVRETGKAAKVYARMTISDAMEYIDYSIVSLLNCFHGIYWQTCDKSYSPGSYIKFSEAYNCQMNKLIDFWYSGLKEGVVFPLPVFNIIYRDISLNLKYDIVRCGANSTHFTIDTKGNIFPCVDSVFEEGYKIGHISGCDSSRHHHNPTGCGVSKRCAGCDCMEICGGACWIDLNSELNKEYAYVKCSHIISVIKHIESYVNTDGGRFVEIINNDIHTNRLFYEYCEKIP